VQLRQLIKAGRQEGKQNSGMIKFAYFQSDSGKSPLVHGLRLSFGFAITGAGEVSGTPSEPLRNDCVVTAQKDRGGRSSSSAVVGASAVCTYGRGRVKSGLWLSLGGSGVACCPCRYAGNAR